MRLKRHVILAGLALLLAGCGNTGLDRTASGAGIGAGVGAGIGALFGGVGAVPGAAIGAGIGGLGGFVTSPDDINLGRPIWRGDGM